MFTKHDFVFDLRKRTVTCPAGQVESFVEGQRIEFGRTICGRCELRKKCTRSKEGRVLQIADDELLQQRFLRRVVTRAGRERLRERVAVEDRLAHLKHKQGRSGSLRRHPQERVRPPAHSRVLNLEALHREETLAA